MNVIVCILELYSKIIYPYLCAYKMKFFTNLNMILRLIMCVTTPVWWKKEKWRIESDERVWTLNDDQ